jgi:peptide chain release factor 2
LRKYGGIFDLDSKQELLKSLRDKSSQPDFWDNQERAQSILQDIRTLELEIEEYDSIADLLSIIAELVSLAEKEKDESLLPDLNNMLSELGIKVDKLELKSMLSDEDDQKNAILTIHPGAGGTESQDWAEMLLRMYLRWIERSGFEGNVVYLLEGEEAGIKDVSVEVKGNYAYGYLKAEAGIHRLVRISPFDSNRRRHTSFASVFVYPEVDNDIEIEIDLEDLKIDTYRASGAGGQHVNKTDSAIRITHLPTGIIVQCQNERSQYKNKKNAMKILRSRLYQLKKKEKEEERSKIEESKKDIAWGNQIRSYVFHPYSLVKDHRTNEETGNIQAVMDGDIDRFIRAYLIMNAKERNREN